MTKKGKYMSVTIPTRDQVPPEHKWNLSRLFPSDAAWEQGLAELSAMISQAKQAQELGIGTTPESFRQVLASWEHYLMMEERVGYYAHLRVSEDEGNATARGMFARFMGIASQGQAAWSWINPAIQALDDTFIDTCLADPSFAPYAVTIRKLRRFKPHVLSEAEERLLALQMETAQTAQEAFSVLTNVDLSFGEVDTPEGPRVLTQSTFASLMRHPDRSTRQKAYFQFYRAFEAHQHTLGTLYAGSIKQDKYQAQVRRYSSARAMALFPDDVPESVYDNLVQTITANLPSLHRYYTMRRKALKLDELRHYDVYVPLAKEAQSHHTYEEAVDIVCEALRPLGEEYVGTLRKGLLGGWVDRYENKGKRSGAFSAGSYFGDPYILLNYKEDVLRDLFTLAHEGGHSMHSWYSAANNPFMCYNYTIFEAEVASTFNEQLVFSYLYAHTSDPVGKAALLANRIDDTLATLFRQTMFAEFEHRMHAMAEAGEAITVDVMRSEYRKLLEKYFGPEMHLEDCSDMEGLRIPHFYNAFYVYKYATGLAASIALSEKVLQGGAEERESYLAFLKSGGSSFPIESLKKAGVDMSQPAPVQAACDRFARDVENLATLLGVSLD